jgi:5'-nucleotidase/UDP-sugar diphosphatase
MKLKHALFIAATAVLLAGCVNNSANSSNNASKTGSDSAGSASNSASQSASNSGSYYYDGPAWVKGNPATGPISFTPKDDTYTGATYTEPTSKIDFGATDVFTYSGTNGTLSKDSVTYNTTKATKGETGYFTLNQGGYFTNSVAFSSFAGLKVTFTRLTDYGYLLYKGSRYEITSPNNGAYHLYSNVYLPLFDETGAPSQFNYLSFYAAVGSFRIDSITLYTTTAAQPAAPTDKYLDFYSINDTHGAAENKMTSSTYQIGITRLSNYYQARSHENPDGSVILSSGDMWQGSADSNMTHGEVMVNWMNLVGFESQAVGNHEFDWGVDTIATNSQIMNFPLLGINIKDTNGNRPSWAIPSKTIIRHGVKIGIIGAIGKLESSIATSSLGGYTFDQMYATEVSEEATRLRAAGCKMVVVSIHNGGFDTTYCQNVDAVFEGHSHQNYYQTDSYGIPHVQCYANGAEVQHLRFSLSGDSVSFVSQDALMSSGASSLTEDPMTAEIYRYYLAKTTVVKNEVVGHTDSGYTKDQIGKIGASSLLWYMKWAFPTYPIICAFINSGGVRQTITAGDITFGGVYATYPFDNENHLCSTTGSNLTSMAYDGNYVATDVDLYSLVPSQTYYFVTLSYLSEGSLAGRLNIVQRDTYFIRNVVADYFRNGGK